MKQTGDLNRHMDENTAELVSLLNKDICKLFLGLPHCTTAGTIEAWNYISKKVDHPEKHVRPDVFIRHHYWSSKTVL